MEIENSEIFITPASGRQFDHHDNYHSNVINATGKRMEVWIRKLSNAAMSKMDENDRKDIEGQQITHQAYWNQYSYWNGFYILVIAAICLLLSAPLILVPQHDSIKFSEYWYELLMTYNLTFPLHWVLKFYVDNKFLLNIKL